MVRSIVTLSLGITIATALCLTMPVCQGRALAAGLKAKDSARAKQAKQLYKEGRYEDAAKIFSSLSSDYPDMLVLTRNLGACYYYLRRPEPALSNLREYLRREQDLSVDDRSEVEGWMAEMEKLRSQQAEGKHAEPDEPNRRERFEVATAAPPPLVAAAPAVPPPIIAAAPAPVPAPASPAAAPVETVTSQPAARSYSTMAWVAGGVGVAGLVAGGVLTGLTLSKFSSTESEYNASDESAGKRYAKLQWVGYGVGAAGIATAIVLFSINPSASSPVALTPILGQGFAGASVAGRY